MFRTAAVITALIVAMAGPAVARQASPASEGARAEAQRLIDKSGGGALFEDASAGDVPGVRHVRSGLRCTFEPGSPTNAVNLNPTSIARGDDVSCSTAAGSAIHTVYATKFGQAISAEDHIRMAAMAIEMRFPNTKPYTGGVTAQSEGAPVPILTRRFESDGPDGARLYQRVSVAMVGPWTVKLRTTSPLDDAPGADLMAEATMIQAVKDVAEAGGR